MASRQIDEQEYNFLQARRQVADFVESIYNDPALSREAKRLIKKKYPNLQIPDYDIEERIESRFDEEKRAREDAEAVTRQRQDDERIAAQRERVRAEFGLTDEGMKEVEDTMIARNIGDYEAGALYVTSKKPKPIEPTFDNYRWNHDKQDGFKEIAADPEAWARKEILNAVRADERAAKGQG